MNNMGLNCVGLLIHSFFSVVNTTVLYNLQLVEYAYVEPQIQRNCEYGGLTINDKWIFDCLEGR